MRWSVTAVLVMSATITAQFLVPQLRGFNVPPKFDRQGNIIVEASNRPDADATSEAALLTPGVPGQTAVAEVKARPLFVRSRRAALTMSEPAFDEEMNDELESESDLESEPMYPPEVTVSAIIVGGDADAAYLVDMYGPKLKRVQEGDTVEEWEVVEIQSEAIVFGASGGQRHQVPLRMTPQ